MNFLFKVILPVVLKNLPVELFLARVLSRVFDIAEDKFEDLLTKTEELVVEAERKYGRGHGSEKFGEVREGLKNLYDVGSEWLIHFLIELAVGLMKKKGVIQ